ncbi:MAG: alpha/beta fold hydrolase [Janthinobacterium lividum]
MSGDSSSSNDASYETGMLDVGDGHMLHWRSRGPRDAPALVIVHGGPGGALNLRWGEFFEGQRWRIVFFDQRGCGRSTPFGELRHNTLERLIVDMEKLRAALGIERWALFGGSWGTTLALAYGAAHPQRCLGFLLRGIFLARAEDLDWFLWDVKRVFPEAHAAFLDAIEVATGRRPNNAAEILTLTEAPLARFDDTGLALARAWSGFEKALSAVGPMPDDAAVQKETVGGEAAPTAPTTTGASGSSSAAQGDGATASAVNPTPATSAATAPASPRTRSPEVSMASLERHYLAQELPPQPPLLSRLDALLELPCRIVHGRFDMVCPVDQATALAKAWPRARLSIADASGHWTFEKGVAAALRREALGLYEDLRHSGLAGMSAVTGSTGTTDSAQAPPAAAAKS